MHATSKNRSPTRALGAHTTPYQAFFRQKPDISRLEEFGTRCWVMVPDQHHAKLSPKAEGHVFVGVAESAKAWKYYNSHSRHVQLSRNITFDMSDTKLHPMPNGETGETELEGETGEHELQPGGAKAGMQGEEAETGRVEEQDTGGDARETPHTSLAMTSPETNAPASETQCST
jgi:hypothetical protein